MGTRGPYWTLEHIATSMLCYASTDLWRLGAPRWDAIDAELVGESSNLCVCRALHVEGGRRHHGNLLVGGPRRELLD